VKAQRDQFLESLFHEAERDESITLITVDMGAPALDLWRKHLPKQVISAGISEQNAINVAAGMSASGRNPYVYFMACWAARCLEQIRYSCAMAGNEITILGNGVGLGYAPAGPAHEPTDDLMYLLSIEGIQVISPSSNEMTRYLVSETLSSRKLRYIRLERSIPEEVDSIAGNSFAKERSLFPRTLKFTKSSGNMNVAIITSGYLLGRAFKVAQVLEKNSFGVVVVDIPLLPIPPKTLAKILGAPDIVLVLEEQYSPGGFYYQVLHALNLIPFKGKIVEVGLDSAYIFDNGVRDDLLDRFGLSIENIVSKVL